MYYVFCLCFIYMSVLLYHDELTNSDSMRVCFSFAGMRGSTPLDVAAASCIDNNELALALQEQDLEMVREYE